MRSTGVWKHIDQDVLVRQIDQAEQAERQARELQEKSISKWSVRGINATEDELAYRIDRTSQFENAAFRQAESVKAVEKYKKHEDKIINKFEAENRKTIKGIREAEEIYASTKQQQTREQQIQDQMANIERMMTLVGDQRSNLQK